MCAWLSTAARFRAELPTTERRPTPLYTIVTYGVA